MLAFHQSDDRSAALIWTVNVSLRQQDQVRQEAVDARYERVYNKLASSSASERLAAIAQLASMLGKEGGSRAAQLLTLLASKVALDESADARSAVVSVFASLPASTDKQIISSTLKLVIQLQANLRANIPLADEDLAALLFNESKGYLVLRGDALSPLNAEQQEWVERLNSLAQSIVALMKSGGRLGDLRGIICARCDFTRTGADLAGVNFAGSLLGQSTWLNMKLSRTNFDV